MPTQKGESFLLAKEFSKIKKHGVKINDKQHYLSGKQASMRDTTPWTYLGFL